MKYKFLAIAFLTFTLSIHGADGYLVSCEYGVVKRLSSRDRAEFQVKGRDGEVLYRLSMTRYASEVVDGAGARLLSSPGAGARPEGGAIQFWISAERTDVVVNGMLLGSVKGRSLGHRPEGVFTPSNGIHLKGRCRIQKLAPVDFSDDFARVEDNVDDSQWEVLSGSFEVNMNRNPGSSQSAFQLWGSSVDGAGMALAKASCWFWRDLRMGLSFQGGDDTGVLGLLFNWQDGRNYHAFTVGGDGVCRLLKVRQGKELELGHGECNFTPGVWSRLDVVSCGGRLWASVAGVNLLEAQDAEAVCGRVGILLSGTRQAYIDDVTVRSARPEDCAANRPAPFGPCEQPWSDFSGKHFLTDAHMSSWAHPRSFWSEGTEGLHWFRSRLFGEMALSWRRGERMRWPKLLRIQLFSEETSPEKGYHLEIRQPNAKKPLFEASLTKEGATLAEAKVEPAEIVSLKASAAAGLVRLEVNGETVLEWQDDAPLSSGMMAADFGKANLGRTLRHPDWRDTALVMSDHRLDYSFENAPAAWFAQSGSWQGTHRWACVPKWSFYGGRGPKGIVECERGRAALWNLRQVEGDFDLELFAAPMEGTPQRSHFCWPVTLNVAFCADGRDLGSGYTFSYGTYDIPSRLLWRAKELCRDGGRVEPELRSHIEQWYHKMTQVWQHIRIQRREGRILVDAATHGRDGTYEGLKRLFDVEEAGGGQGGQFAIWTWENNGLSIARATLSFQDSPGAAKPHARQPERAPVTGGTRHFCNPERGGLFQAVLASSPIDVRNNPRLAFRWRPGPNVSLSLFLSVRDQVLEVPLAPGVQPHDFALGGVEPRITALPDGWQEVEVSPAQELLAAFPDGLKLEIDQVAIATPFHTLEEIGGIGVNAPGAYFDVGELRMEEGPPLAASPQATPSPHGAQGFHWDFEESFGECERYGGFDGAALSLDARRPASGRRSLRLFNQRVDGPAGAVLISRPFRLAEFPRLSFKLRMPEGVETHLVFRSGDRHFDYPLTREFSSSWPVVGSQDVPRDDQWHEVAVDLAAALEKRLGKEGVIHKVLLADSGCMSTRQRIAYHLDDLRLVGAARGQDVVEGAAGEGALLAPMVSYIPSDRLCRATMERGDGAAARLADLSEMCIRRECWLSPTTGEAATGEASAEVFNLEPHGFCSLYFRRSPWDPKRWPCVGFDYCFKTPGCQLVLELLVNEVMTVVEWTGPTPPGHYFHDSVVGRTAAAIQDGKWHHVEFNLLEMLREKRFQGKVPSDLTASELATWGSSHHGHGYDNPQGARILIDNFTIYSPRDTSPAFEWRMPKGSLEADGYACLFDQAEGTVPPEAITTRESRASFQDVAPGVWYFHLRAHSPTAGWGPAAHCKVVLE